MATPRAALGEILAAGQTGRALTPENAERLARALAMAVDSGTTIEAALGMSSAWRRTVRRDKLIAALRNLAPTDGSLRGRAEGLHTALRRYRASAYLRDARLGKAAQPGQQQMFELIRDGQGRIPTAETLRKWLKS